MIENEVVDREARTVETEIIDALDSVETIMEKVGAISNRRTLRGKTIEDWDKVFEITIDPQADPALVNIVLSKLCSHMELVSKHRGNAGWEHMVFMAYYGNKQRQNIEHEANRKGKRTPSLDTMERLAEAALGDKALVRDYYEFEIDFWDSKMKKLITQLDLVKTYAISNGTKTKIGLQ